MKTPCKRFCRSPLWISALALFVAAVVARDLAASEIDQQLADGDFTAALKATAKVENVDKRQTLLTQVVKSWVARYSNDGPSSQQSSPNESAQEAPGAAGGGSLANFTTLINLIESTIEPPSWDVVGGEGSIMPFANGVYVDASGTLQRKLEVDRGGELERIVRAAFVGGTFPPVRQSSALRKISLPRLERHVADLIASGEPLGEDVRYLAGLERIEYVFVDDEHDELVIAGPAGDWMRDDDGRIVAVENGRPIVELDDLVVMLRHAFRSPDTPVGCSINPRPEALARAQAFLKRWEGKSIDSRRRKAWLEQLRGEVGKQDIEYFGGIDPGTRVARVMVEADYRMKLVGMGLEAGVDGVPSYLDLVAEEKGRPSLDVLRWWFAVDYDAVMTTPDRRGYALAGQGAVVLSENEMLTRTGRQVHTGQSERLNRQFAESFTSHFDQLAAAYPVYADLQNVFDLALVAALLRAEDLPHRADWSMPLFGPSGNYEVALGYTPAQVETVVAHRVVDRRQIIAGVSGGVMLDVGKLVRRDAIETTDDEIKAKLTSPPDDDAWWWD